MCGVRARLDIGQGTGVARHRAFRLALGRVLGVCAALDVGALTWTGQGFDTPVASGARPAVDLGPLAHLRVLLSAPLSLEVRGAAVIPLIRDRFVYGRADVGGAAPGTGLAYEPGAVGATLDAGLHLGFDP